METAIGENAKGKLISNCPVVESEKWNFTGMRRTVSESVA
jgi:hypothetical protein